ncbi:hypothetical protein [Namhaeicola litoreus]|uniref:UbiA prenyltransferase family protein n=1 Tax=Namhaeicola litoreus TaxID=1052145 RepID=A0ABW3Y1K6_9FLAO
MTQTKNILDFYIRSNIHVGISAGSLAWITLQNFELSNLKLIIFVIASTILAYHFIRIKRKSELEITYQNWMDHHRRSLFFVNLFCAVLVVTISFHLRLNAFLILIPSAIITYFYVSKISGKYGFSLREVSGIKIVTIALIWAVVTVIFPLIQEGFELNCIVWIIFFQRVLFVFSITIPFDIRDLHIDNEKIRTIPSFFGVTTSKRIGQIALLFFVVLEFFKSNDFRQPILILSIAILAIILLEKSRIDSKPFFISFWIEGIPILWLLLEIAF